MKKRLFILIMSLLVLASCKEKRDELKEDTAKEQIVLEELTLKVKINAKVLVDDVFEVYFYEPGMKTFHPEDFVFTKVSGDTLFQEIIFELPENIYPERLRLDFGKNMAQQEMEIISIRLLYGSKEYEFSNDEIINKFKPSKFIDFDIKSKKIKPLVIDGRYDPYFYTMKVTNIVNYLIED